MTARILTLAFLSLMITGTGKSQTVSPRQKNLVYEQLTNGLTYPEFEGGRTEFEMEDVNQDGHVDLISIGDHGCPYVNADEHGIMVWLGDGAGNFTNHMTGEFGYGGVAVADVNNDGFMDAGYGMHHNYSSTDFGDQLIEVALGDGSGVNWTPWDDGLATNGETWGMFGTDFGDINNDGWLDLVSVSFGASAGLHVYANQMDGQWVQSFGFVGGNCDMLVQFGDINRDGNMDILAAHQYGTAYFGDGTGTFVNNDAGLPATGNSPRYGVSMGDVDLDGGKDLAFTNPNGGVEVWIWDENAATWVDWSNNLPASGGYELTELADMNSDGFVDVMGCGTGIFQLWLGDGAGNWTADAQFTTGDPGYCQALRAGGDLDHNGYPDIVILSEIGDWISYQNYLKVFRESSPADSLWIRSSFPMGNEKFFPGSVQFIRWVSEVPEGMNSSVDIEISAFGPEGPWWLVADGLPNNGTYQWTVPPTGSDSCYLKLTVKGGLSSALAITAAPFTIVGNPTREEASASPGAFMAFLSPNPVTDCQAISLYVPLPVRIRIDLLDLTGSLVRAILPGQTLGSGHHEIRWSVEEKGNSPLAKGVYVIRIMSGRETFTKKIIIQ
jgi:hypothetical protein